MLYFVAFLSCSCLVAMLALVHNQNKLLYGQEDVFGLVPLMLPVEVDSMQELFNPAEEWNLRSKVPLEVFKVMQRNRRRLAVQYATHMYRNAGLLQRLGRAAMRTGKTDRVRWVRFWLKPGLPLICSKTKGKPVPAIRPWFRPVFSFRR